MAIKRPFVAFFLGLAAASFLAPSGAQQSAKPDFHPVNMKLVGTNLIVGKTVKIEADIKNLGEAYVRPIIVKLYVGTTPWTEKTISGIAKNSSKKVIFDWVIHADFTGDQVFKIVADDGNGAAEADETNNIATLNVHIPEPGLNMTLTDFTFTPAKPEGGKSLALKATVKNTGTAIIPVTSVSFYVNDVLAGTSPDMKDLKPGMSKLITMNYSLPLTAKGTLILKAVADPFNINKEQDENDNVLIRQAQSEPKTLDLTITKISFTPPKPKSSDKIKFNVTVKNGGGLVLSKANVSFRPEFSSQQAQVLSTGELKANQTKLLNFEYSLPTTNLGSFPSKNLKFTAIVDPDNLILESNENNNSLSAILLEVSGPDLSISENTVVIGARDDKGILRSGPVPKGSIAVASVSVHNTNVSIVENVKVRILAYKTASGAGSAIVSGETTFPKIEKNKKQTYENSIALPGNLNVGEKVSFVVLVDPDNKIFEADKSNNRYVYETVVMDAPRYLSGNTAKVRVYDETDSRLDGVSVTISGVPGRADENKTTGTETFYDSSGQVIFESLPDTASLKFTIQKAGYRPQNILLAYNRHDNKYVEVRMDKKAGIFGKVSQASGQPLAGTRVFVRDQGIIAVSDDKGNYSVIVPPGNHVLSFQALNHARQMFSMNAAALSNVQKDVSMAATTVGYVSAQVSEDGAPLDGVAVKKGESLLGTSTDGKIEFTLPAGMSELSFSKTGYQTSRFKVSVLKGEERILHLPMELNAQDGVAQKGVSVVANCQMVSTPEGLPVPEYGVNVFWGLFRLRSTLNYETNQNGTRATKLAILLKGEKWEIHVVEGSDSFGVGVDIPITIAVPGASEQMTKAIVEKVSMHSAGEEIWSTNTVFTSADSQINRHTQSFDLNKIPFSFDQDFQVKIWVKVVNKETNGPGPLAGWQMDKKLLIWYPARPVVTKVRMAGWEGWRSCYISALDNPISLLTEVPKLFEEKTEFNYELISLTQQQWMNK